jgi:hypothetical protein
VFNPRIGRRVIATCGLRGGPARPRVQDIRDRIAATAIAVRFNRISSAERTHAMKALALGLAVLTLAVVAPHAQQATQPPPPTPSAFVAQAAPFKQESIEIKLAPMEGMEYKYRLAKGAGLMFSWTGTAAVHYELHSEPEAGPKGYAETFDKHDAREEAHGNYVAPFAGIHGWYWENRTDRDVTLKLTTAGHYTESLEFRRKQDVKRKLF